MERNYSYENSGFNSFLTRSIDDVPAINLDSLAATAQSLNRELNYDHAPTTGALGSSVRFGNILIDGVTGRISIYDESNNEVVRLGKKND